MNLADLREATQLAVRFLDDVIDYNTYHNDKNKKQQMNERRIGLGTLGLGELLIRCGITYGQQSLPFIEELYRFLAIEAYCASIDLAKEKGAFPGFDYDQFVKSGFVQKILPYLPEQYKNDLKTTGIRNVTLLTAAPVGTTGTMIGTSTGIEPYFKFKYLRTGRLGTSEVNEKIVEDYKAESKQEDLPSFFITADQIKPIDHVLVQATIQKWIDSSISKTVNMPSTATVEDVADVYNTAYDYGCKGVTVYRDKSIDSQVLHVEEVAATTEATETKVNTIDEKSAYTVRPNVIKGQTEKVKMPGGKLYVTSNFTDEDGIVEMFISAGERSTEVNALCNYIGRLISIARKYNVPLQDIVSQGYKVPGGEPFFYKGFLDKKGRLLKNIPSTISHILNRFLSKDDVVSIDVSDPCPSCGKNLRIEEGCKNCPNCGFSKCS